MIQEWREKQEKLAREAEERKKLQKLEHENRIEAFRAQVRASVFEGKPIPQRNGRVHRQPHEPPVITNDGSKTRHQVQRENWMKIVAVKNHIEVQKKREAAAPIKEQMK